MYRKGQGISIDVVIIAAIALLILVILSVLVIRTGGGISRGTSCEALGGVCTSGGLYTGGRCDTGSGYTENRGGTCSDDFDGSDRYCCILVG